MADTISMVIQRLGFPDILLWLLTFALVYGILSQVKVPASKSAQAIIAFALGFLVVMAAPANLLVFLTSMSSNLILVVLGLILLMVFLEVFGIKARRYSTDEKTGKLKLEGEYSFLSEHPYTFAGGLIIIVGLLFVGSGGLGLMGLSIPTNFNMTGVLLVAAIVIAVLWMIEGR